MLKQLPQHELINGISVKFLVSGLNPESGAGKRAKNVVACGDINAQNLRYVSNLPGGVVHKSPFF